jgi:hypothetical protein
MKIQAQLVQWVVLFGGAASAVYFWRPATTETNREVLESNYNETVDLVKKNNKGLQEFLTKQKNRDPELEAQFNSVLTSGHKRRMDRNKNIVVGIDDDV